MKNIYSITYQNWKSPKPVYLAGIDKVPDYTGFNYYS